MLYVCYISLLHIDIVEPRTKGVKLPWPETLCSMRRGIVLELYLQFSTRWQHSKFPLLFIQSARSSACKTQHTFSTHFAHILKAIPLFFVFFLLLYIRITFLYYSYICSRLKRSYRFKQKHICFW